MVCASGLSFLDGKICAIKEPSIIIIITSMNLFVSAAEACSPLSLGTPVHGRKSCTALSGNSGFRCELFCDDGYVFYDQPASASIVHTCNQGDSWNVARTPACVYASEFVCFRGLFYVLIDLWLVWVYFRTHLNFNMSCRQFHSMFCKHIFFLLHTSETFVCFSEVTTM